MDVLNTLELSPKVHYEVLVGVVLVDVHLYLDLQHVLHHGTMKYNYATFSHILVQCTFIVQNILFGTDS